MKGSDREDAWPDEPPPTPEGADGDRVEELDVVVVAPVVDGVVDDVVDALELDELEEELAELEELP
ncbi:MAG: hypothetical protein ACJ764_05595 [Solirubrobacteraceae bacterium]